MITPVAHTVESLFEAIQTLPIDDQYELCGRLYDLLHGTEEDFPEPPLSDVWLAEIDRRVAEEGESEGTPGEDVIAELRRGNPRPLAHS